MVSAAEQLASNLNLGAFAKAEDLKRRLWFTVGAFIVYRLGTFIPLPGINPAAFAETFKSQSGGILGMFNMFSGGALRTARDLLAQHHALHLGLDHHAVDDVDLAEARGVEEGRRGGPKADQPVYALHDGGSRGTAGLRHRRRP